VFFWQLDLDLTELVELTLLEIERIGAGDSPLARPLWKWCACAVE
jgi:hypothetical protein